MFKIKKILFFHINHQITCFAIYFGLYIIISLTIFGANKTSLWISSFMDTFPKKHPLILIAIFSPTIAKIASAVLFDESGGSKQTRELAQDIEDQKNIDNLLKKIKNSPYS